MKLSLGTIILTTTIFSFIPVHAAINAGVNAAAFEVEAARDAKALAGSESLKTPLAGDDASMDRLLADIRNYMTGLANKGLYEEDFKRRLAAISSIWSLGEIGNPIVMEKLAGFYFESDEVIRMNILISIGKLKNQKAIPFLRQTAASENETMVVRSVAFELLEALGDDFKLEQVAPSKVMGMEDSDIIFTGSFLGTPIGEPMTTPGGHVGLFVKTEVRDGRIISEIVDCMPNVVKPGGVRKASWSLFTTKFKFPFYGNRTTREKPSVAQRAAISDAALAELGHRYNNLHDTQKGPLEFDCVGLVEYAYESAGLNPTPDTLETGWSWPLTPAEQFLHTVANQPAAIPYINAATPGSKNVEATLSLGLFGVTGLTAVDTNITPASAD